MGRNRAHGCLGAKCPPAQLYHSSNKSLLHWGSRFLCRGLQSEQHRFGGMVRCFDVLVGGGGLLRWIWSECEQVCRVVGGCLYAGLTTRYMVGGVELKYTLETAARLYSSMLVNHSFPPQPGSRPCRQTADRQKTGRPMAGQIWTLSWTKVGTQRYPRQWDGQLWNPAGIQRKGRLLGRSSKGEKGSMLLVFTTPTSLWFRCYKELCYRCHCISPHRTCRAAVVIFKVTMCTFKPLPVSRQEPF